MSISTGFILNYISTTESNTYVLLQKNMGVARFLRINHMLIIMRKLIPFLFSAPVGIALRDSQHSKMLWNMQTVYSIGLKSSFYAPCLYAGALWPENDKLKPI
jgi:hypothetical protein